MLKRILLFLFFALQFSDSFSQLTITKYWIRFTDKNNSPYSISNPEVYLSPRAIDRRARFNIAVDWYDLPVNPQYVDSVLATGVQVLERSKWLNSVTISTSDSAALAHISQLPFVLSSTPVAPKTKPRNYNFHSVRQELNFSNDPFDYGKATTQFEMIDGKSLHFNGYRGEGMQIAMLDEGFLNTDSLFVFDSININHQILGTWNFVDGGADVFNSGSHGSACLSTIAANSPGVMIGTAPHAKFWLLHTENHSTENPIEEINWVSGAEFADSVGADVLSCSLGYTRFDSLLAGSNNTYSMLDGRHTPCSIAATICARKGMIVCNSAGNEGSPPSTSNPSPFHYISAPADADSIITVGATDIEGNPASFTSYGPSYDGRVKPDVAAMGVQTQKINAYTNVVDGGNGTSFSCPTIAGMTACLWQAHPDKTNMEVIHAIQQSGSIHKFPDDRIGYGIPDFEIADMLLSGYKTDNFDTNKLPILFPNPFSENGFDILIQLDGDEPLEVEIFDMMGKLLMSDTIGYSQGIFKLHYNLNLADGVYTIRLTNSNTSYLLRGMKVN